MPKVRERLAWNPVPCRVLVRWLLLWIVRLAVTELVAAALGRPSPEPLAVRGAGSLARKERSGQRRAPRFAALSRRAASSSVASDLQNANRATHGALERST
jgi:hypothetical protein